MRWKYTPATPDLQLCADEDVALAQRHSLHIDQLFDELVQFLAAEPELTAEGATP